MNKRFFMLFLLLLLFVTLPLIPVFSQEKPQEDPPEEQPIEETPSFYQLGDQVFSVQAGLFIPLYYRNPYDFSTAPANLTLGGTGGLEYSSFINSTMTLGLGLKGMFAYTPTDRLLSMFPITAKFTYYLSNYYPFEFPLYVNAGLCISRLESETFYGPTIIPGAAAIWNMSSAWGFGINMEYWWVPMWYGPSNDLANQSRFGNFMDISLSATYHF